MNPCEFFFTVQLLRILSTHVPALLINQEQSQKIPSARKYLFGVENTDWSRIIIDMFSNKLDKLCIRNNSYRNYLSFMNADKLRVVSFNKISLVSRPNEIASEMKGKILRLRL